MTSTEIQARHVFHTGTTGMDRIHAWREATGEPAFVWGRRQGDITGALFGGLNKAFDLWEKATSGDPVVTLYHDGASADAFGMKDSAAQKVYCMHDWFPRWERGFDWTIRCTGKVVTSHSGQAEVLREQFGWIPERFIQEVPEPRLSGLMERQADAIGPSTRTGIWLHGKKWRRYGNRLRSIADRWPESAGSLEFIVSGSGKPGWSKKEHIIWNPDLPLEFALQRIFTWDSTLLIDDYSLDAPWLKRALSLNCFPLIPDGENPGRPPHWEADSAPQPYPWGDCLAASKLLQEWRASKDDLLPDFREWVTAFLQDDTFKIRWQQAKEAFIDQRSPKLRKRRSYYALYPVAWFERLQRLRSGQ